MRAQDCLSPAEQAKKAADWYPEKLGASSKPAGAPVPSGYVPMFASADTTDEAVANAPEADGTMDVSQVA